jgi:23S rRNA (cytidine1920-2'-O)/16S rRNA (cytidine1409-2'-O)-methyltransferase
LRLDDALVERGMCASRSRARDSVLRGTVAVNGARARKPSQTILQSDAISIDDAAQHYVSRAALKLIHGLDHFHIQVDGRYAVDIGASTGGFTQVLLERGAAHVTAIDVGHGQMVSSLVADQRVTCIENLNARDMTREHVPEGVDLVVSDVSFISLKLALLPTLNLMHGGADLIALIKPQFEVGRENLGRGGIVKDAALHAQVCGEISTFLTDKNWNVTGVIPSQLEGGDGNVEFLIAARKL